ncbi:MAG: potassium channel family protein [Paracoccaceae bacterium]
MRRSQAFTLFLTVFMVISSSTVLFHYIEGWSLLDSYFFTVVTISTVGYGNLVPVTAIGKIATTLLIFFGLAIFAVAIQQFGMFAMRKREEHTEWLIARLSKHVESSAANTDRDPDP